MWAGRAGHLAQLVIHPACRVLSWQASPKTDNHQVNALEAVFHAAVMSLKFLLDAIGPSMRALVGHTKHGPFVARPAGACHPGDVAWSPSCARSRCGPNTTGSSADIAGPTDLGRHEKRAETADIGLTLRIRLAGRAFVFLAHCATGSQAAAWAPRGSLWRRSLYSSGLVGRMRPGLDLACARNRPVPRILYGENGRGCHPSNLGQTYKFVLSFHKLTHNALSTVRL